jgi:hypothetical protein
VSDLARDRIGDISNGGATVAGEQLVEYAPPIIDQLPFILYSGEEILELHRLHNLHRVAPRPALAPFRRHSLRRFS